MSARIQNLSIVVAGALAVACSKPSEKGVQTPDQTTAAQLPTFATPAGGDQPMVSAIETSEHSELKLVRPAERKPPQPVVVSGKGDNPGGRAISHALDLAVTPNVTPAAQSPSTDVPITMAMAPVPSGPAPSNGEGQGTGVGHGRGTLWQPDPPSTIIIRGGMGGIDDDCKRHPGGFAGGIAINNRMPSVGHSPVLANNPSHRPFIPGRIGGMSGIPRRGIR